MGAYRQIYDDWRRDPQAFWAEAAAALHWDRSWDQVFDAQAGVYGRWFAGAQCNTAYNCLDAHVEAGRGDQPALIYDSPITGVKARYSYAELTDAVARFAAILADKGVGHGDRVLIYMPMIPQAAIGMLACARLGAIHSVVFGGFAADELAKRIDDATPRLILTASCGIEPGRTIAYKPLLEAAIEKAAHKPDHVIVYQRDAAVADLSGPGEHDWQALVDAGQARADCVTVAATDPLYILYTSGTTGTPKGVVRDHGGHMTVLHWSMKALYGIDAGDVFWAASDVGWVVGHSYIVYAPLLAGATTVLFEGKPVGTPDAGVFWRVIAEHDVKALFTAPTAIRAIRKADPEAKLLDGYDLTGFKTLFLAGERADPDTVRWAEETLAVPVIDHWWQTETGWPVACNPVGVELLPVKHGSASVPVPGYEIDVLDEAGAPLPAGELGSIAVRLPLPPGCLPTLWRNDARFRAGYLEEFPGYYSTSDAGLIDSDGYIHIMARTDDIINVAGHRLSTGGMEEVLATHPCVAECAVIGVADALKGQVPLGRVVLKDGVETPGAQVERECVAQVRQSIGAVAALKTVVTVDRLPKTRSGKILRKTIRQMADGENPACPATIDDPAILDEIADRLAAHGVRAMAAV